MEGTQKVFEGAQRTVKRRLSFLKRRFVRPPYPVDSGQKLLLHIGCGKINSPDFINIDAQPYAHVHVVTDDISRLTDFADETADLIYMCHILEHIRAAQVESVLREMRRVLKVGGVLRLSVPDFDRLVDVYKAAGEDLNAIHTQLMGGQDSAYNVHYCAFNRRSLSELLLKAGFTDIRPWDPGNCRYHDFKDKACKVMTAGGRSFAISLNLEAVK
jgi:predicted SAM-dependent methyltransferase